jgi:hypothetical protein
MTRALVFLIAIGSFAACSDRPAAREPKAAAVAAPPRTVDAEGLRMTFHDDGTIDFKGVERWGRPLDATYESADWLKRALPALALSVTAKQRAALDRVDFATPARARR